MTIVNPLVVFLGFSKNGQGPKFAVVNTPVFQIEQERCEKKEEIPIAITVGKNVDGSPMLQYELFGN